ncbi:hypothetical protein PUN28_019429 [Cardiocondyla obscurior]|uniref:Uncharacterized protein n=1 Tax=Cardiocondyla obscurior TaxID=286306 RepID=A0AAW2EBE7_9HYME
MFLLPKLCNNIQEQSNTFENLFEKKCLDEKISNWMQHEKQNFSREKNPFEEVDVNLLSSLKNCSTPEISLECDENSNLSLSSTSEYNSIISLDQPSTSHSSSAASELQFSPSSLKCTYSFKKPSPYVKGKFNSNILYKKDLKSEFEIERNLESCFINLNQVVLKHLNKQELKDDGDAAFCNVISLELKKLQDDDKQKKKEIINVLWKRNK